MHSKFCMRTLAVVLALVMVFGLVPARAFAAPAQADGASAPEAYKTIAQYLDESRVTFDQADAQQEVEFIVELEDAPLAGSMPAGMKLGDYLATYRGSVQANAIETQQAVMAAAIEDCAEHLSITHTYQVVLNGFAVRGTYADRAALEALDGVKRVTIGNVYSVPETQQAQGEVITSGELINSDAVNAEGYTGKGTFAAIVDTGLNVSHEAFVAESVQGAVVTADTIAALEGLTANGDLYKNAKVAFAYDYADGDDDVSDAQGHGTHVAGTVGANGESFRGVAPDAQLAILKVFGDTGGAYDSDIFAALEDCVILGVDTVNMSLGTPCGFTYESDATEAVYNAVRSAGINLMVSAGNDYNSAYQNLHGTDLALAENPDYGIVGSPSTYAAALSIASVNEALAYTRYFLLGDTQISYDENPDTAMPFAELEGTYEYVQVPGVGSANDFADVDVTGKIALVERGEIAFTEKEQNAYDSGAIALIVCNNSDAEETVYMQLNGLIPAVFISKAEGKLLQDAQTKTIAVSADYAGRMESPVAGEMSDFSSMGVTPDLRLKPELTAPGGNVWSTSASGGYEEMSGTSMAAPHMTGAAAVMRQYVNEVFPALSDYEKQALIDNLLLSTANPVLDENGVAYTPRKQGAGLANISAAVHSGAYLTVNGGKPKAELGENAEGSFQFTFTVHNISDTAKTYRVDLLPIAAQVETVNGYASISELCRAMTGDELTVTFSAGTVTVQPGETADVTVTLALTETGKQNLAVFPNGIYIEGFVQLTGDGVTTLGLPYLGFYGDWNDAPVFDSTMYDDGASFMAEGGMVMMDYDGNGNYLGINAITGSARAEWISYASKTAGYYLLTPMQGLLRAPKEIWYTAAPAGDPENEVYTMAYENAYKSFYYSSGGYIYTDFVPWEDSWQPIGGNDADGYHYLEDGWYNYTVSARIDGETEYQALTYPVYIDNSAPEILSYSYQYVDGAPCLIINVRDDHYVMAAQLVDEDFTRALSPIIAVEETEAGVTTALTFDLTNILDNGYASCRLDLYDYAWNETLSDPIPTNGDFTTPVDKTALDAAIAQAESLDADTYTAESWAALSSALEQAKAVSADPDATQAQIDEALAALNDAISKLEPLIPVDFSSLLAAIEVCEALAEEAYTSDSWAALEAALEAARAVAADPNATQAEVNTALEALTAAQDALVLRGDNTQLAALYTQVTAEYARLAKNAFPAELIAALEEALANAEAGLADIDATQEALDALYTALLAAWNAVESYPVNDAYTDVAERTWFYDEVDFVTRYGFMKGMTGSTFVPDGNTTRAQFVTILYRVAGEPAVTGENPFTDVRSGAWYTNAVLWAYQNGITSGVSATSFDPDGSLVRQSMVTFLMRFAKYMGVDTSARADLSAFTDAGQIGKYARDAMSWAVAEGIINGMTSTTLGPNGLATRAQIAAIIQRFVTRYLW